MGHSVTLGGERVGSGNKNKIYLRNYERSTHNLSRKFSSTMGVGMLIPFMCIPATRDDKFEIDLNAGLRTIPTKGPLFGSFKLQLDVYQCPRRLYQALLHNNPLAIGLKANQVKWPKMRLWGTTEVDEQGNNKPIMAANNSLIKYLGISGIGTPASDLGDGDEVYRDMVGDQLLAYYDIFKNYYANKQEEDAYVLDHIREFAGKYNTYMYELLAQGQDYAYTQTQNATENIVTITNTSAHPITIYCKIKLLDKETGEPMQLDEYDIDQFTLYLYMTASDSETIPDIPTYSGSLKVMKNNYGRIQSYTYENGILTIILNGRTGSQGSYKYLKRIKFNQIENKSQEEVSLTSFALENIDRMRMDCLSFHQLGQSFILDSNEDLYAPYSKALGDVSEKFWQQRLSGICVKTYQSDLFNNWIKTEWIDGENGIAAVTAISTSSGSITIDALQFSEKLYNLLNRIAVSGATYEDYLDAAYTESAKKFCEAPMWVGGMSDEIVFEEIVQTAPADGDPLGTLGGRGNLLGKKQGGKITIKVDEPSYIIGIVSITPRVDYTQGNEWWATEIDSLADIHVPALDAIGFQNLLAERMHAGATIINADGTIEERPVVGKVPAWIEYMTAVDQAYGDFAATDGDGYMILNRDYDCYAGELRDATTYIDPAKYNYAFAYTKRDAQNFWVQIKADIKARRLMSAKQIPTA